MEKLNIIIKEDMADSYTPYNKDFVFKIKRGIGGAKWNASLKCWSVPSDCVDAVRDIMKEVYGHDDTGGPAETVSIRLRFEEEFAECHGDVTLFGRCLSHAYGRDSGATCGSGVNYIKGYPKSGGSMKNWCSVVPAGAEIFLKNVPKILYESYQPIKNIIVDLEGTEINADSLLAEKERLNARIAEIDKLLADAEFHRTMLRCIPQTH